MTPRSLSAVPLLDVFYREFYQDPLFNAFYRGSGYANFGYWDANIADPAAAGDRLVEKLLEFLPERRGKILDVACGHGASTKYLSRFFKARNITGIGIVPAQIESARQRAPKCRFTVMDATTLDFRADRFDVVICVEAAFHFQTRARFFAEAFRVLKPGGYLLLSDLLMAFRAPLAPRENHLADARAYADLLKRIGFKRVKVCNATDETWLSFRKAFGHFMATQRIGDALSLNGLRDMFTINVNSSWAIRGYVLAAARKPRH
jgi:SAM-dependent methyltransferase